jgi:hypothetical protein
MVRMMWQLNLRTIWPFLWLLAIVGILLPSTIACAPTKPRPASKDTGDSDVTPEDTRSTQETDIQKTDPKLAAAKLSSTSTFIRPPSRERVLLLYTASVQGYVEPCGCTQEPLGGIARWAAAVDEARSQYTDRVLLLDAGDLLFEKLSDNQPADACQTKARHQLLVSTYDRKGLAATVLGPRDLVRGHMWRDALFAQSKIATIDVMAPSAGQNGSVQPGKTNAVSPQRYLMKDLGGIQIGVTGFRVEHDKDIATARQALGDVVNLLYAEGAQSVVALSQSPRKISIAVSQNIAGLDAVIQGRDPGELPVAAQRLGEQGPVLVAAGMQSQHLGIVELDVTKRAGMQSLRLDDREAENDARLRILKERIKQYTARVSDSEEGPRRDFLQQKLIAAQQEQERRLKYDGSSEPILQPHIRVRTLALNRGRSEEPKAKAGLEQYDAQIPELTARCEASIECPQPAPGAPVYMGVQACFTCHREAVQFWENQKVQLPGVDQAGRPISREVGHSRAWQTLQEANKTEDRTCVGCHSVGFNEPGGYCRVKEIDFRQNVQCESCHGPGSLHIRNGGDPASLVVSPVKEQTCRRCHHVPHIPTTESFVFEEKLRLILGPGHGEEKRKALGP